MRISINTLYCINYISHFTNVIWGNGDGKYENLSYHCVLIKWKEAWESAGSAAGRDSCPHRLFGGGGEGRVRHPQLCCNCGYFHKSSLTGRAETRAEAQHMMYIVLFLAGRAHKW